METTQVNILPEGVVHVRLPDGRRKVFTFDSWADLQVMRIKLEAQNGKIFADSWYLQALTS